MHRRRVQPILHRLGQPLGLSALAVALLGSAACGESREEALKRQQGYETKEKKKVELPPEIPPDPMREQLRPLLEKVYTQEKLPDVLEADIEIEGGWNYELEPGVMSVIRVRPGISASEKAKAIIMATAEADGWAYRKNARKPYAELIHKVKRGYGDDQKDLILKSYADLKLMTFFNGPNAEAAVGAVSGEGKAVASAMMTDYTTNKDAVWDRWMNVKMYARRAVSGYEPFRTVLREIRKELGKEEPPPRTWEDSMDAPFKAWAAELKGNEELLSKILNMRELRAREEYLNDTHTIWAVQGSEMIPAKAKKVKIEKDLGFGVLREDLGGGYNDLTIVFSKKLKGSALKYAWLRSVIYGSLFSDFGMLATAGSDFAKRDADNRIDPQTSVVPDKYDPLYARCASEAALDTLITNYKSKHAILADLRPTTAASEAVLDKAHNCVIAGAQPEIYMPGKDNDKDVEGPAPGSRLAIYQMLARFENVDVNMAAMGSDAHTEEDDAIDEAEALLKKIKAEKEAGKGIK